jgi:hypothetical protein
MKEIPIWGHQWALKWIPEQNQHQHPVKGGDGGGGQGKVDKEQIAKEKRKALDVKSAGTQHRHPRGKSHHI